MSDENNTESSIETPLGKLAFKGNNSMQFVIVFLLMASMFIAYVLWEHKTDAREAGVGLREAIKEMTVAQRESTVAQREMNCLISLPQDKREAEFHSPNGLCKRISR